MIYLSFSRLFTICKNTKPPKIIRQIVNRLEKANSLIIRLNSRLFLVFIDLLSKSYANSWIQGRFIEI